MMTSGGGVHYKGSVDCAVPDPRERGLCLLLQGCWCQHPPWYRRCWCPCWFRQGQGLLQCLPLRQLSFSQTQPQQQQQQLLPFSNSNSMRQNLSFLCSFVSLFLPFFVFFLSAHAFSDCACGLLTG